MNPIDLMHLHKKFINYYTEAYVFTSYDGLSMHGEAFHYYYYSPAMFLIIQPEITAQDVCAIRATQFPIANEVMI